jgi:hypothetical protein
MALVNLDASLLGLGSSAGEAIEVRHLDLLYLSG